MHGTPQDGLRRQSENPVRRPRAGHIVQYFKDDATAFNAEKKAVIEGKGVLNNRLSEYFMTGLTRLAFPRISSSAEHARAIDPSGRNYSA